MSLFHCEITGLCVSIKKSIAESRIVLPCFLLCLESSVTPALFHSRMTITSTRIEFPYPANQRGAALESNLMFIPRRVND